MTAADHSTVDLALGTYLGQHGDEDAVRVEDRYVALTERLLDATRLHLLPQPAPLVEGFLDRDSLAWCQGKPGHAKSFVALDVACHVALGRPWRGRKVTQGRVLYIVAEGAFGMERRLRAWEVGNQARVTAGLVTFLPVAVQLLEPRDVAALRRVVQDLDPALIVIDTQARVTVGGEENSSKDMGQFVQAADRLRLASGATVLVVHHEARHGENLRGSTAMEGAASTIIRVKKEGLLVEVTCVKQKDGPEFDPIAGTLMDAGPSVYWSHGTVGLVQLATETENHILAIMRDLFGTSGASSTTLLEATGLAKSSFHRGLNALVGKGILRNDGTKYRTLYVLCDEDEQVPDT